MKGKYNLFLSKISKVFEVIACNKLKKLRLKQSIDGKIGQV